jgi:DNA-binding transcriptional ArsR family regulator
MQQYLFTFDFNRCGLNGLRNRITTLGERRADISRLMLDKAIVVYYLTVMQLIGYELNASPHLDATFAALADPTRRAILARLAKGEASVMDLAEPFAMSQPAISKHLKVLERAGLISRGQDAQRRPRRLEARPLRDAAAWLEKYRQFWGAQFQRLDALLREMQTGEIKTRKSGRKMKHKESLHFKPQRRQQ